MVSIDLTWVIGGPQGGGVETAANIFAGACAASGLKIFGKREYYSSFQSVIERAVVHDGHATVGAARAGDASVRHLSGRRAALLFPPLRGRQ